MADMCKFLSPSVPYIVDFLANEEKSGVAVLLFK